MYGFCVDTNRVEQSTWAITPNERNVVFTLPTALMNVCRERYMCRRQVGWNRPTKRRPRLHRSIYCVFQMALMFLRMINDSATITVVPMKADNTKSATRFKPTTFSTFYASGRMLSNLGSLCQFLLAITDISCANKTRAYRA